mmetsp:Transcript_10703/g.13325  ORF Transcript_10703/g.13325 Transcript_10703/m.13325 type:complete len:259 (-) Transcript_10703:337-1113(-)
MLVTNGRPALSATMSVVTGVLGTSSHMWSEAQMARLPCLTKLDELCFSTADLPDGAPGVLRQQTHLATRHLHSNEPSFTGENNGSTTSCASNLTTISWVHLNVVDHGTNGHLVQGNSIAHKNGRICGGENLLADKITHCVEDVTHFTILILDQANTSVTVRIILDGLDCSKHVPFGAPKIDHTVLPCMGLTCSSQLVLVSRLSGSSGCHLDRLMPWTRKAPTVHVAQRLVSSLGCKLLKGGDTAVPQGIVLWFPHTDT